MACFSERQKPFIDGFICFSMSEHSGVKAPRRVSATSHRPVQRSRLTPDHDFQAAAQAENLLFPAPTVLNLSIGRRKKKRKRE